jgi:hypothetical protein
MKNILIVIISLLLIAAMNPFRGIDGYIFKQKEYQHETVEVTLITYKTHSEFSKAMKQYNILLPPKKKLAAFAILTPGSNKCTIHAIDPYTSYEPEYLGHELTHCFFGRWHPD